MSKSQQAQAATMIRKHLKANGIQARVTSSSASMTSSVDITLTDALPATVKVIEAYVVRHMWDRDCGTTTDNGLPKARFVSVNNTKSEEMKVTLAQYIEVNALQTAFDIHTTAHQIFTGIVKCDFWTSRKPRIAA